MKIEMSHTVELTTAEEARLRRLSERIGVSVDQTVRELFRALLKSAGDDDEIETLVRKALSKKAPRDDKPIRRTKGVMGGDACIRNTRIPVWLLVSYKSQGMSDSELLRSYPGLTAADLVAAWDYYAAHSEEVEKQRRRHEEAA